MPTKQVTVGTTMVKLVDADSDRRALAIHNSHATNILYVSDVGSVSTLDGFHIQPTTSLLLSEIEGVDITKKWVGIANAATTVVSVLEGFYRPTKTPQKPDIQDPHAFHDPPAQVFNLKQVSKQPSQFTEGCAMKLSMNAKDKDPDVIDLVFNTGTDSEGFVSSIELSFTTGVA